MLNTVETRELAHGWGYPLLEGDRFVGRIELKADRKAGALHVLNLWHEDGVRWSAARSNKLTAELARLARLAECRVVVWK